MLHAQASWTGLQPFLTDSSTAKTTLLVMAASLGHHSSGVPPASMALMHFPEGLPHQCLLRPIQVHLHSKTDHELSQLPGMSSSPPFSDQIEWAHEGDG